MKLMDMAKIANDFGLDIINMSEAGHQKFIDVCLLSDPTQGYFVETARNNVDHCDDVVLHNIYLAAEKIQEKFALKDIRVIKSRAHLVMNDITPYISQIDGTLIESRSKHRTHLRDNNCIEIGNEVKHLTRNCKPLESPAGLKEQLIRVVNESQRKRGN